MRHGRSDTLALRQGDYPAFSASGGSAVNGTYAFVDTSLFEERSHNAQMQTYLTWLNRVAPGATPSFFGMFAWGAAELFT